MGCGCIGLSKERANYDNTKRLARAWAKSENKTVIIYKNNEGYFRFIDLEEGSKKNILAIEYISPLQGNTP